MPIPPFNEIKAPALAFFAYCQAHRVKEAFEALPPHFNLTESEKNELLPSGKQRRWHNRANWACYDVFRAGLLRLRMGFGTHL
jgi:restriction system protein